MAFNNWPYTNFQDLNLGWILNKVKEAVTKATEALSSSTGYDARIATAETNSSEANTKATEALSTANSADGKATEALSTANNASDTASAASANATQARTDAARALSEVGGAIGSYKIFVNAQNQCSHAGELINAVDVLSALNDGRDIFVERADADNPYNHIGYQFAYYDIDNSTTPATTTVFFDRLISYAGENAIVERMYLVGNSNTAGFSTIQTLASKSYVDSQSGGGGGSAPYQIPVDVLGSVYTTTATGAEIYDNLPNCFAVINGLYFYPVGAYSSGPYGTLYLAAVDPHTQGVFDIEILQFNLTGANAVATVQHYTNDITTGEMQKIMIAASSAVIPPLQPNKLYVFTGDAATLNITLATPSNSNIANEYHFLFYSGATPTTLTLPSTIRQPAGFTVEANHWYEVSILENNMLASGWAVSST